jgi:hypothetical protein
MEKKLKFGINAGMIVCIVLGTIGLIFLLVGIFIWTSFSDEVGFGVGLTFFIFGCLLLLSVGIVLLSELNRRKRIRRLVEDNRYVWGTIESIVQNRNIRINSRHPYYALVRYRDHTGTIRTFRSRNVMNLPNSIIGQQIKVYVDESNYRRYYVDLDRVLPEYSKY